MSAQKSLHTPVCTCRTTGKVHAAHCGCEIAAAFLAEPTVAYNESRRAFLRRALVGSATAALLPLLGESARADLFKPSASEQKKAGQQAAQQVLQKYHVVKDERSRNFERVGAKLVNALNGQDRKTWDYSFSVIESKEINAFALPGGPMFMFTGLLDRIHSNDELAAVTGHEMTHVRKEHWAKAVAKQRERELALGIGLTIAHAGRTAQEIAGLYDQLTTLSYSRKEEDEADAGGLQNMFDAGFDPHGMLDLFHTLETAAGGGGGIAFLSDHPLTKDRVKHTQERIAKLSQSKRSG